MPTESLEERIERLEAVHEIQNVMGRYSYFHTADMQEATVALWAKGLPDLRIDMPWGVYEGPDAAERCYLIDHQRMPEEARAGALHVHTLTTPVIEVAGEEHHPRIQNWPRGSPARLPGPYEAQHGQIYADWKITRQQRPRAGAFYRLAGFPTGQDSHSPAGTLPPVAGPLAVL